jgi:hypothetical protein
MGATEPLFEWHLIQDRVVRQPRQRVVLVGDGKVVLCTPSEERLNSWKSPLRVAVIEIPITLGVFVVGLFLILQLRDILPDKIGLSMILGLGLGIGALFFIRVMPHLVNASNQTGVQWLDLTNLRVDGKSLDDALSFVREKGLTTRGFVPADFSDAVVEGRINKRMTSTRANVDWFVSGALMKTLQSQLDT